MSKKFNRDNCTQRMRAVISDALGNVVVLSGKYAFEWTITTYTENGITRTEFKCGKDARKEFNKIKQKSK